MSIKSYTISGENNGEDYPSDTVKAYNTRSGKIETGTDAKLYIDVEDTTIVPREYGGDVPTEDYRLNRTVIVVYDMRDTVLKVFVARYAYDCNSNQIDEDDYEWTDGFSLELGRSDTLNFEFDINKYFENGKISSVCKEDLPYDRYQQYP